MNYSELGYIVDFIASFWIIQSIILRSKRHIKIESETFYDGNPFVLRAQLHATADGWIGLSLFLIGLILHLVNGQINLDSVIIVIFDIILISYVINRFITGKIEIYIHSLYTHYAALLKENRK